MPDDHSKLVPLLPIPNRTVKRLCADDSAGSRVKVGHRQALIAPNPLSLLRTGGFCVGESDSSIGLCAPCRLWLIAYGGIGRTVPRDGSRCRVLTAELGAAIAGASDRTANPLKLAEGIEPQPRTPHVPHREALDQSPREAPMFSKNQDALAATGRADALA